MIREVQLTNFMSYKNASVPLEPGLNLIVGPNGAGKSSILLAISVVLGQAYTERSRKLSELIRWGEQEARISLKLDNTSLNGAKPFPQARTEEVLLTRVLKRNGDYLYLLNNKPISKTSLAEALSRIGLNPDNMLVIMHQLMVGRFGSVSPTEKLLLLEDAIGFRDYRRDVLDASTRLQKLITERETMSSVLEGTKETYLHWQREYEKFELKRKLESQFGDLQRELVWRRIIRKETSLGRLKERIGSLENEADTAKKDFAESESESRKVAAEILSLTGELERFREEQLKLEHGRGFRTAASQYTDQVNQIVRTQEKLLLSLEGSGAGAENMAVREGRELKKALSDFLEEQEKISRTAEKENQQSQRVRAEIAKMSGSLAKATDLLIESRVLLGVSKFKLSLTTQQLEDLELQLRLGNEELEPLTAQAAKLGARFENPRDFQVVSLDLASVQEKLRPLAHLSEEVEKMYRTYGEMYEEMKKKAEAVEHNRTEVLGELRERFDRWQAVMAKIFEDLSERYSALLAEVGAKGRIVLKASKDIEKAGLELYAGFKGNEPVSLDSLAPSGGERTISLIAFLLSLQQYVSSPFRAIDEFDVHMDPRNRETVSRLIYAAAKTSGSRQYIAITPGQVSLPGEESVHVVVVQSVEGSSVVKELK
jgi:structural maintenance of chromosomes protein 5